MVADRDGDIVLGDDFVAPNANVDDEMRVSRENRGFFSLRRSPLARKIITFNLIALNILVAGIFFLNSSRDGLAMQRTRGLVSEAELIADTFEVQMQGVAPVNIAAGDGINVNATLRGLDMRRGVQVFLFDTSGTLVGTAGGRGIKGLVDDVDEGTNTYLTDGLSWLWEKSAGFFVGDKLAKPLIAVEDQARDMVAPTLVNGPQLAPGSEGEGRVYMVSTPVMQGSATVAVVALASTSGEIDRLVRAERERVLRMFVVGIVVSIGLSLVLASTIANPLSDLAEAAEIGRDKDNRHKKAGGRIRIPDLTARPDEVGRLSGALRGMVSALYDRIDGNEQFAADVAHEIKNPLASLRSAVGSLRMVKKEEQRNKLLDVIEHDVRRLDRLVSDISNASRLDSELVKEEQESFDLLKMLGNLCQFLGEDASSKGVEFITDLPSEPIIIDGLEARLAQVFVNLITNATSFCEDGDAIRVWARQRENRVLVVVEDTGPGIPEEALQKVFKRFYSERPEGQFGNNSGLGLAISKQIIEAHDGVIWAENIRPTDADITSDPLGARFVVGLPV
ncbi:sensor histidine kinase [Alisedimentitalea sp. MJ-SS2]|uniref:sensor histidine kinase n=1 Tax=Aliisedimentitalea sp. MJ-SS2 TaxID=3049795 RepID=UPI002910DA62|nr:sensor histidine kinase [Alisedimentitalea sp. MJ-SS2]MDU8927108.1 sensor histidine kinase [Alisedimentitalea sp. MJ-SS2]